jgi:hypothetical protein
MMNEPRGLKFVPLNWFDSVKLIAVAKPIGKNYSLKILFSIAYLGHTCLAWENLRSYQRHLTLSGEV